MRKSDYGLSQNFKGTGEVVNGFTGIETALVNGEVNLQFQPEPQTLG